MRAEEGGKGWEGFPCRSRGGGPATGAGLAQWSCKTTATSEALHGATVQVYDAGLGVGGEEETVLAAPDVARLPTASTGRREGVGSDATVPSARLQFARCAGGATSRPASARQKQRPGSTASPGAARSRSKSALSSVSAIQRQVDADCAAGNAQRATRGVMATSPSVSCGAAGCPWPRPAPRAGPACRGRRGRHHQTGRRSGRRAGQRLHLVAVQRVPAWHPGVGGAWTMVAARTGAVPCAPQEARRVPNR
jgi:hypothetical protein